MTAIDTSPPEHRFADAHLAAWAQEREIQPWPLYDSENPSATELYNAYSATLEAEGQRRTNLSSFTKGLVELGYEPRKNIGANVYPALSVRTRRQRAEAAVIERDPRGTEAFDRVIEEATARHMATVDHGEDVEVIKELNPNKYDREVNEFVTSEVRTPRECKHDVPDRVYERANAAMTAVHDELRASGWLDREVERRFGYYLNGHPFPHEADLADQCADKLDILIPKLDQLRPTLARLRREVATARQAYLDHFHTLGPYRQGDPEHMKNEAFSKVYYELDEHSDAVSDLFEETLAEAERVQAELREHLRVLSRYDRRTGEVRPQGEPAGEEVIEPSADDIW